MNSKRPSLPLLALLLSLLILPVFLPALDAAAAAPLAPAAPSGTGEIVLIARDVADLEWEPTYTQPFLRWELYRGLAPASLSRIQQGTNPTTNHYRDTGLTAGVQYYYRLDAIYCVDDCSGSEDERTQTIFSDDVTAGLFQGRVRHDLTLADGTYEIGFAGVDTSAAVYVEDDATLIAGSDTTIRYPGGSSGILVPQGRLEIDGATLDHVGVTFGDYYDDTSSGKGWVRNATFVDAAVSTAGQSDVVLAANKGLASVSMSHTSQATISDNEIEGSVEIRDSARATVTANTITNADLLVNGPGAHATIRENTITEDYTNMGIRVWDGDARVSDNTLTFTDFHGSESTVLISIMDENTTATVERNMLNHGKIGIAWGSTVTVTDNVLLGGGSAIGVGCVVCGTQVQARGLIARNTVRNGWGFEMWAGSHDIPVQDNCIEGNDPGMTLDDFLTGIVDARHNWWGAASGPTHATNPSGTGDRILGNKVNFLPFDDQPTHCRDTPPAEPCILVQDQWALPVEGAEVYVNGLFVGTTPESGKLCMSLQKGDRLIARHLQHERAAVKENHDGGWSYRVYLTSMAPDATSGEPAPTTVSDPTINQVLTLLPTRTLVGFNVLASVEWDATAAYLADLRLAFERASAYLYDATDGQMLFERVDIVDDAYRFPDADYRVHARNDVIDNAHVGGIWGGSFYRVFLARSSINPGRIVPWSATDGFRTMIHEFGHYGLRLYDSYIRLGPGGATLPAACTGPAIVSNAAADVNATLMDYHYNASEFAMQGVPGLWSASCSATEQFQRYGLSDWESIAGTYSSSPNWTITTPAAHGAAIPGPDAIPVSDWSNVTVRYDADTGVCAPPPTIQVEIPEGAASGARVTLERQDGQIINQGLTDKNGKLEVLGAASGDTIHMTYRTKTMTTSLTGDATITCAPDQVLSLAPEPPPLSLDVRVEPGGAASEALVIVEASAALSAPPIVSLRQTGVPSRTLVAMTYDGANLDYRGTATLSETLALEGDLWVIATSMQGRTVYYIFPFKILPVAAGESYRVWSDDGKVVLYLSEDSLTADTRLVIYPEEVPPAPATSQGLVASPLQEIEDLVLLSGPYTIAAAGGTPLAGTAGLSLYYTAAGGAVHRSFPPTARLYRWDGTTWLALESAGNPYLGYVTAPIDAFGTFVVMAEEGFRIYLPVTLRLN